jgi:hypothetical protein
MRARVLLAGALLALASLLVAPAARATFHEMWIREVYGGSPLAPSSQYVELQMWAPGQNLVAGHVLRTYGADGSVESVNEFTSKVANDANQSTILLGTSAVGAEFGVAPDTALEENAIDPAGGAVCWEDLDCVSWGGFIGSLPWGGGSPAPAIPSGMALRRTIAPLCPTALDGGDDRNDSLIDFSAVFPAPRPNSVAPSERTCPGGGGGTGDLGGGGGGGGQKKAAPQTTLRRKPAKKTHDRTPTFRFSSNEAGSTFQCKLDGKPFKGCRSPLTTMRLSYGPHTFKVRARDRSGKLDPSPASYGFNVVPRR